MSSTYVEAAEARAPFDWKRVFFLFLGVALFCIITDFRAGLNRHNY